MRNPIRSRRNPILIKAGCSVVITAVCWRIDAVGQAEAMLQDPFGFAVMKDRLPQQRDVLPSTPVTTETLEEAS